MTGKTRFNHFVPRFYLKSFSIPNMEERLWCFDKFTFNKYVTSIRRAAGARNFYDEKSEHRLDAEIESIFSPVYRKLVKNKDVGKLFWNERVALANFVAIQDNRTQEMRAEVQEAGKQVVKWVVEGLGKDENALTNVRSRDVVERYIEEAAEKLATETQAGIMFGEEIKQFADAILSLQWILCENKTDTLLWTSDNPINKWNSNIETLQMGNLGYLSTGIEMFLPVTPKLFLFFCDLGAHRFVPTEKMVINNPDNIMFQNYLQIRWSKRYIFSQDDDFKLAEKILKEQPSFREPYKKRIKIY